MFLYIVWTLKNIFRIFPCRNVAGQYGEFLPPRAKELAHEAAD
jgi:hypothetical protein